MVGIMLHFYDFTVFAVYSLYVAINVGIDSSFLIMFNAWS